MQEKTTKLFEGLFIFPVHKCCICYSNIARPFLKYNVFIFKGTRIVDGWFPISSLFVLFAARGAQKKNNPINFNARMGPVMWDVLIYNSRPNRLYYAASFFFNANF